MTPDIFFDPHPGGVITPENILDPDPGGVITPEIFFGPDPGGVSRGHDPGGVKPGLTPFDPDPGKTLIRANKNTIEKSLVPKCSPFICFLQGLPGVGVNRG